MAELPKRLAELTPGRRQLLERWLARDSRPRVATVDPEGPVTTTVLAEMLSPHKAECQRFYDSISRSLDASELGPFSVFLNLGYADAATTSHSVIKLPEHSLNRNSMRLVLEVIGQCDLEGRRLLDVGCGRGGTVSMIKQFFKPRSICGVDLAPAAVRFCQSNHRYADVSFEVGDAECLSFADRSFDVVTNIESSSTYPDISAFYRQVFRLLVPRGYFLYTDALPVGRFTDCTAYLRRIGFHLELDRDITANVLASCDEIASHRLKAYGAQKDGTMADFLAAPGSRIYDEMKRGEWSYRIQRWRKAATLAS